MIGKKELSEALALSCVEKYFLAWLKSEYDVSSLYGYSFVEIKRVLEDFAKGARYEDYRSVPRVQPPVPRKRRCNLSGSRAAPTYA